VRQKNQVQGEPNGDLGFPACLGTTHDNKFPWSSLISCKICHYSSFSWVSHFSRRLWQETFGPF